MVPAPDVAVFAVDFDPVHNVVWVGTDGEGVFSSRDRGYSWHAESEPATVAGLRVDAGGSGTLFAFFDGVGVVRAAPEQPWTTVLENADVVGVGSTPCGGNRVPLDLAVLPGAQEVFLAHGRKLWLTRDGGDSWDSRYLRLEAIICNDVRDVAIAPSLPTRIYANSFTGGLVASSDGGDSWPSLDCNWLCTGAPRGLVVHPTMADVAYVGTIEGVAKTTNGDGSVTITPLPFETEEAAARGTTALAIDPTNPMILYAAGLDDVYWTRDGGASWERMGDGLGDLLIFDLAVDPEDGTTVYAATSAGVAVFEHP